MDGPSWDDVDLLPSLVWKAELVPIETVSGGDWKPSVLVCIAWFLLPKTIWNRSTQMAIMHFARENWSEIEWRILRP